MATSRQPRKLVFKRQFTMSTNSTSSTDAGVPSTSPSSPTSSSDPPSTSSIANSSPSSVITSSSFTPSPSTSTPLTTSSSPPPTTSSNTPSTTPSTTPTPTTSTPIVSSTPIGTTTEPGGSTVTVFKTSTQGGGLPLTTTGSATSSSTSGAGTAEPQQSNKGASSGLGTGGTIAVAVVVPIVVVALLLIAGLFLWRKRKARKDAEELRRKEVEEYGYNPNNDPTLPAVGVVGGNTGDGPYEMREDGSSGYRGWGTTAVASSGRKASTTVSGGQSAGGVGMAYSEGTSPTHGPVSDTRSDNPLMDRSLSPEGEALGAMGPAASANRTGDINRGPSNASSSYSAANRSDGSGEIPATGAYYNNQYDTGNPYTQETAFGSPPGRAEMSGQPVIRDVQARRNTRIENPSHFPQQSAGISQNF